MARRRARPRAGRTIGKGASGEAVRALQNRLSGLGYAISADGRFGPETEKALREFQKSRGAKVDGVVGQETVGKLLRAKMAAPNPADVGIDAITKVVGTGQKLPGTSATGRGLGDIKAQTKGGGGAAAKRPKTGPGAASKDAGGHPIATNKTGPIGSTTAATPGHMTFEKGGKAAEQQPAADGDFEQQHPRGGPGTEAGGKFVKKGDSGQLVSNTQTALTQADGAKLKVDGQFGPRTEAAVRKFQQGHGLQVDGIVGIKTSGALRRALHRSRMEPAPG